MHDPARCVVLDHSPLRFLSPLLTYFDLAISPTFLNFSPRAP